MRKTLHVGAVCAMLLGIFAPLRAQGWECDMVSYGTQIDCYCSACGGSYGIFFCVNGDDFYMYEEDSCSLVA